MGRGAALACQLPCLQPRRPLQAAQAAKAAKAAAIKEQQARELADADARAEAEAIAEARKMAGIRARATANKDFLRTQIVVSCCGLAVARRRGRNV